jgi:lysophospholipase L1-like esterase
MFVEFDYKITSGTWKYKAYALKTGSASITSYFPDITLITDGVVRRMRIETTVAQLSSLTGYTISDYFLNTNGGTVASELFIGNIKFWQGKEFIDVSGGDRVKPSIAKQINDGVYSNDANLLIGKVVALLGDSITMQLSTSYPALPASAGQHDNQDAPLLKAALKLQEVINCGIGGATWQDRGDANITAFPLRGTDSGTASNTVRMLKRLITAGRPTPDVIVILFGTNNPNVDGDFATVMAMTYSALDADATYRQTMYGGLRYTMETVTRDFPNAIVIAVKPMQSATTGREYDKMLTTGNAIEEMAKRYSIQTIDALHDLGVVQDYEVDGANGVWLGDGLHPNADGRIMYSNFLANNIKNKFFVK